MREGVNSLPPAKPVLSQAQRGAEVLRVAETLFGQDPAWVTFFREILGVEGVVRQMFPSAGMMKQFENSEEYARVLHMLAKLREKELPSPDESEPTRMITVRLPASLHEAVRTEAHQLNMSLNRLCITKLLQYVDDDFKPMSLPPRKAPVDPGA